jgi:hypothetical protein
MKRVQLIGMYLLIIGVAFSISAIRSYYGWSHYGWPLGTKIAVCIALLSVFIVAAIESMKKRP